MDVSLDHDLRRMGVLGGTFDPIHVGHLVAATEVIHHCGLDRVVLVPAGRPWQKSRFSDPEDRFMMTVLAAATHARLSASRIEIDRKGPTYTIDTLEAFRKFFDGVELVLIVGADALRDLATWHRIDEIGSMTQVVAVSRPGIDISGFEADPGWPEISHLAIPGLDISSTDIRARAAQGKPIDYLVPAEVARYIRERGLYVETREARGA